MGYTSEYAQKMMSGGGDPKKRTKKVKPSDGTPVVKESGNIVRQEKLTRDDAKDIKRRGGGGDMTIRQIKKSGSKVKY